ncbi:response regulator transcription factor [Rhodococcus artemisiae]|uniref:Response regulator transcription factor n=1 Tax=Rhodococcus artemisiae TaxID=714159 RepID=A0ABU7LJQ9_9NOCA|nr:response regulator transcription factor [Rhodococcus artemisiae]MEE2061778.1 response regulator transcription factor [Rhodococcus artemisiae]
MTRSTTTGSGPFGRNRPPSTVVLCESDPQIAASLIDATEHLGVRIRWCRDGASALYEVGAVPPTVLILADRIDGVVTTGRVIATVREHTHVPILVGADSADRSRAQQCLHAGGSAVITRPYDSAVVTAFLGLAAPSPTAAIVVAGPITVHSHRREVRLHGREVVLTPREFDLLMFLIDQCGTVVAADEIASVVWGQPTATNTVAVHVKRLRDKLGDDPDHGQLIRTVRGRGYRLAPSLCP